MSRKRILKVALYPYDDEMYPYLKCSSMLDGIKICYLVSPKSWGIENENVCGLTIRSCLSKDDYDKIDAVWVGDSVEEISKDNLLRLSREIASCGKQMIITRQIDTETYETISDIFREQSGTLVSGNDYSENLNLNENSSFIDYISTPIISVSGPGEHTDKFLTQLLLKEYLEKNGYRVTLISSRNTCGLLKGVYSFPTFMDYDDMSAERKIVLYNRLVKKIEKENNPDIIIVGIPGSVMPSSRITARNFELAPYSVFKAIKPSYSIMCLYGNYVTYDYLDELRQTMKYKYGSDVDFYYRSSVIVDVDMVLDKTISAKIDETAYIYDDISCICDIIMKK